MLIRLRARVSALLLLLALGAAALPPATPVRAQTPPATTVTIIGTVQSKLGCASDAQPDCAATALAYDAASDIWTGEWTLPAGSYTYQVAVNKSADEVYGQGAARGGKAIALVLTQGAKVKFYYDHKTHWASDNGAGLIVNVAGSFQSEVGCKDDWMPACLKTWLQDPDGDGVYTFTTKGVPAGSYEAKVAANEGWTLNWGAQGAAGGANIGFSVSADGEQIQFIFDSKSHIMTIRGEQAGSLALATAHWVSRDTIAWNPADAQGATFRLHYSPAGALKLDRKGVTGGDTFALTPAPAGLSAAITDKFPQLKGFMALKIAAGDLGRVGDWLKGQVVVSATGADGKLLDATGLQIPGVLDDLYRYDGPLGLHYEGGTPHLALWAPTARAILLHVFDDATTPVSTTLRMAGDPTTGLWTATGTHDWDGKYYLYEVEVYTRASGAVEHNLVTDPYAVSLAPNSTRSQFANLNDPPTKPAGWDAGQVPALRSLSDSVIYELHLRDFSIGDQTVPEAERGTYLAFTHPEADGMKHLKALAVAGLTHVHLLPVFDLATIEESRTARKEVDVARLQKFAPGGEEQQQLLGLLGNLDGYNWGYDPYHYGVPEGSYAVDPTGTARIREFRAMVQGLHSAGLRVVMDVVYNHTAASGQDPHSVLDRIVPGYYHRLNAEGAVETSTCCQNTATEHAMMAKLMIDTTVQWARAYKVDGFRFDLMGHHMKADILKLQAALRALTPAKDGVDGSKIYLYGEGWDFGEVAKNGRGVNATQINMAGTGIGTFNDRLRDAVRGGGPFSGVQEQGFVDGLALNPNGTEQGSVISQTARLLHFADLIRVGLAGNLKDYAFVDSRGQAVTGAGMDYNGQPAGYTATPLDNINYVEAHDNETLYDAIALKAPAATTMAQRVRMQNLGLDLVGLGQGIPFFHAGGEILRSKSLDRNSYNSGDWFNQLDWTYQSNNWGVGLPPAADNEKNWPIMRPLLENAALKPQPADIGAALTHFTELLRIRSSSRLFRLESAADVQRRVRFLNTGPQQVPGLIVMSITDQGGADLDPERDGLVVLFNATGAPLTFRDPTLAGAALALHPIQAASADATVRDARFDAATGTFTVPALTTAVFALPQGASGPGLAANTVVPTVGGGSTGTPGGTPGGAGTSGTPSTPGTPGGPSSTPLPSNGQPRGLADLWWVIGLGVVALLAGVVLRRLLARRK